ASRRRGVAHGSEAVPRRARRKEETMEKSAALRFEGVDRFRLARQILARLPRLLTPVPTFAGVVLLVLAGCGNAIDAGAAERSKTLGLEADAPLNALDSSIVASGETDPLTVGGREGLPDPPPIVPPAPARFVPPFPPELAEG